MPVAAVTARVVTAVTGLTVTPRLDARKKSSPVSGRREHTRALARRPHARDAHHQRAAPGREFCGSPAAETGTEMISTAEHPDAADDGPAGIYPRWEPTSADTFLGAPKKTRPVAVPARVPRDRVADRPWAVRQCAPAGRGHPPHRGRAITQIMGKPAAPEGRKLRCGAGEDGNGGRAGWVFPTVYAVARTASVKASAASRPRLFEARGLSPVRSFLSWWTLPVRSLLRTVTPCLPSRSATSHRKGPGR